MPSPIDSNPIVSYGRQIRLVQTELFGSWLDGLRDHKARVRIADRLKRLASETPEIPRLSATVCKNCGCTSDPATVCITFGAAMC